MHILYAISMDTKKAGNMILEIFEISIASLVLMAYGFYLGQFHQSFSDIAGILMFFTGIAGLVIALITHFFVKKYEWYNHWYVRILNGVVGCGLVFFGLVVYARIQ